MSSTLRSWLSRRLAVGVRLLLMLGLALGLLVGTSSQASAADDYPHRGAVDCSATYGIYSWCINNNWYSSRLFAYRNCTDWVAWRIATTNGVSNFNNNYGGRRWGNANTWDDAARALGIAVNGSPARGAIAQTDAGSFGHVAWVSSVNGDGTVTVEEYNRGGRGEYGVRTVPASAFVYIHVRDLANDNPFGAYDGVSAPGPGQIRISGWTIDPNDRAASLAVHVYVDGGFQGSYASDVSRPDVANAFPGSGDRHGFDAVFSQRAGRHSVCVYAINIGAGNENTGLGCRDVQVANGDPFGALDSVTSAKAGTVRVQGWSVDPNDRQASTRVHVYVGGRAGSGAPGYDIGPAAGERQDVAAAIAGAGSRHGFDVTLNAAGGTYPVCAYAINFGGGVDNTELRCLEVTVTPALSSVKPKITGSSKVGSVLSVQPGQWGPTPVSLSYQWLRNGATISTAVGPTYTLSAVDEKAKISVRVTGRKAGYATVSQTSSATSPVLPGTLTSVVPRIAGTLAVGSRLTATPGAWKPAPVSIRYQWRANGVAISKATASTLKLATAQRGKAITVMVIGAKSGYTSVSRTSSATARVK